MTTKHTPAPWFVDGADTNWTVYGLNDQGYNRFSAQIQRGNTAPMEHTGSDEITANARLIAAAPEHHAVALELDKLMLVIESAVRRAEPGHHAAVVSLIQANIAALAKARGAQ